MEKVIEVEKEIEKQNAEQELTSKGICPKCDAKMTVTEVRFGAFAWKCKACGYEEKIYE